MDVEVEGVGPLVNRLMRFDKGVYKILRTEVKAGADLIAQDAKKEIIGPALSGWGKWVVATGSSGRVGAVTMVQGTRDLSYAPAAVRASIKPRAKVSRRRGKGVTGIVGQVRLMDPAGAIYSRAGAKTDSWFGRNLNREHGTQYPRALYPAWERQGPKAGRMIEAAIDRAAAAV